MCRTASFDVFCVEIRAGVLGVDDLKNPPKNNLMRKVAHAQKLIPLHDTNKILQDGRCLRYNHLCEFW